MFNTASATRKHQGSFKFILLDFITKFINKTKERLACGFKSCLEHMSTKFSRQIHTYICCFHFLHEKNETRIMKTFWREQAPEGVFSAFLKKQQGAQWWNTMPRQPGCSLGGKEGHTHNCFSCPLPSVPLLTWSCLSPTARDCRT